MPFNYLPWATRSCSVPVMASWCWATPTARSNVSVALSKSFLQSASQRSASKVRFFYKIVWLIWFESWLRLTFVWTCGEIPQMTNIFKVEKFKKIAWIQSHHLHQKFKLLAGKFTWGKKAKHCWVMFWKVCWQCPAMFFLYVSSKLSRP